LEAPEKHWKFSAADVRERRFWGAFMAAYQDTICRTSAPWAPWVVVPADRKWYARLVVAATVIQALESLAPDYPQVSGEARREVEAAKRELLGD
jgi:polyphosphate kinase 2 (PPK2 family)